MFILVGTLSGPAAELTFKFLITFNIVGILNARHNIVARGIEWRVKSLVVQAEIGREE